MSRPPAAEDERTAVERCRSGDIEGLRVLYEHHSTFVYRTCFRILGDAAQAEDEAQEVFLSAFHALPRFDGRSQLSTWLYRIAVNRCLNRRRDGARVVPLSSEPAREDVADAAGPHEQLEAREVADDVQRLLDELPEVQRALIVLRDVEELSYAEIAEVMAIPIGTVMSRLHRARRRLREIWTAQAAAADRQVRRG